MCLPILIFVLISALPQSLHVISPLHLHHSQHLKTLFGILYVFYIFPEEFNSVFFLDKSTLCFYILLELKSVLCSLPTT
jgi:hypothetical protein